MAVNINREFKRTWPCAAAVLLLGMQAPLIQAKTGQSEPVQACIVIENHPLTKALRESIAQCLEWKSDPSFPLCSGYYEPRIINALPDADQVSLKADAVSFYNNRHPSQLTGNVEIQQDKRVANAQTAYIYRNSETNAIDKIVLLGNVHFREPGRLLIAQKALLNPQDRSGHIASVIYRLDSAKHGALLPAWGRAAWIERFANKDLDFQNATYSHCAPQDRAWEIAAKSIYIDDAKGVGVARNATLRLYDWPILYTPYLSFPANRERKSGFLIPQAGYSSRTGGDLAFPYYWNMAPNYDATLIPHLYTERGLMLGGNFRYLTEKSRGLLVGHFLPDDQAFKSFLWNNKDQYPQLNGLSTNRWSLAANHATALSPNLNFNVNYQQVSDDYYLQDFSTNLALLTERQLLREAALAYTTEHWLFRGLVQSYQTLNPVNLSLIEDIYQRLPQLMASGTYTDLPLGANFHLLGEYDQYRWPKRDTNKIEGARVHLNPILSRPLVKPWGYFTPSTEFIENYYDASEIVTGQNRTYNRTIPRFSADSGLYFDRNTSIFGQAFRQTLEPRLYYLNVPYQNQTAIPVYDSAWMIFNVDQLFRTNRFSGYDRIGDANQLSYAVTSRWISESSGFERASLSLGQIHYFSKRKVGLCQNNSGYCLDDPLALGYLSPDFDYSPIASRAVWNFNARWGLTGDYIWDPATHATNNGQLNLHYQPGLNEIIQLGYTYLVNGDLTRVSGNAIQNNALHQASLAFSWPLNAKWSTLGVYSYNISKGYKMLSFLGLQYDSCCWALRVMGGQSFSSLNGQNRPEYNNNVYLQILLKGLGSVASMDPSSTITTYIPGYRDQFH